MDEELALRTKVTQITERKVVLYRSGESISLDNDTVIVCVGGVLPTPILKEIGIAVETEFGTT